MSRYIISGYYGFGNAGDEAILQAIIDSLQQQDPQAEITVFSAQPHQTTAEHKVKAVHRTSLRDVLKAFRNADLFISGGGGLLQDATSSRSLLYYLGLLTLARWSGCRTMVYANSIGPIKEPRNKKLARYVLERVDYITVRDEPSLQLLQDLGVRKPPIKLTADPVLLLELAPQPPKEKTIVVAVRQWPSQHNYLQQMTLACRRLVQEGFTILLIPFHYGRDLAVSEELAQAIGPGACCLAQPPDFSQLLTQLSQAEVVVAMRLHALIMGAVCKRPLVGISYDPKVDGFLQSVGQPLAGTTDALQAERLYQLVLDAYQRRAEIKQDLAVSLQELRNLAAENAIIAHNLAAGKIG
ncbi:MAG: polysaccharide pyruvyl transferase CsaB [Firmicutes bacterium]|nr:polysaccharide pyruvyl transferase CsaB [Bacillota bacterium]